MYLKLFDENAISRLVNIGLAQSIEEFVEPEAEDKTTEVPEIFQNGIRIIWNEQIDSEDSSQPSYFSEQLFFGITFVQLQTLLIANSLYIKPATRPAAPISNGQMKKVEETPPAPEPAPEPISAPEPEPEPELQQKYPAKPAAKNKPAAKKKSTPKENKKSNK